MRTPLLITASIAFFISTNWAEATVSVAIDLTHQRMHVESGRGRYDWPISSARSGFYTPGGSFAPTHLELMHYSRKYHMSPMPHAIFFRGGYAIHGTYSTASLGRPASHGCVRLSPGNAASLYTMVKAEGARISISGTPPASQPFAERRTRYARGGADTWSNDPAIAAGYGDVPYARVRAPRRVAVPYGTAQGYGYGYGYSYPPQSYGYRAGSAYPANAAGTGIFGLFSQ